MGRSVVFMIRPGLSKRLGIFAAIVVIFTYSLVLIESPFNRYFAPAAQKTPPSALPEQLPVVTCPESSLSPLWDHVAPMPQAPRHGGNAWIEENQRQLKALFVCMAKDNCGPNQTKIVILHSHHFKAYYWKGVHAGSTGGENIWGRSIMYSLGRLGYTYLYAEENDRALQIYQLFPSMVKAVLMEFDSVSRCFGDGYRCIKSDINPEGFPIWLLFSFHFWPGPQHPLGAQWVLSPENYTAQGLGSNNFLGYSVEPGCMERRFVPHNERPKQGYAMAKRMSYFSETRDRAWPVEFFDEVAKATDIRIAVGAENDTEWAKEYGLDVPELPTSITNLGVLPQDQFMDAVARSRVLIGVGKPAISPTPYEGLCFGVPFINPIIGWDGSNPQDRSQWQTQHGGLKFLDPPYVYNVFKDDKDGFVDAVAKAIANPINRFIHPDMSNDAVERRLTRLLETDWREKASRLLEKRQQTGEGQTFVL